MTERQPFKASCLEAIAMTKMLDMQFDKLNSEVDLQQITLISRNEFDVIKIHFGLELYYCRLDHMAES